jgi:hypothetical protein
MAQFLITWFFKSNINYIYHPVQPPPPPPTRQILLARLVKRRDFPTPAPRKPENNTNTILRYQPWSISYYTLNLYLHYLTNFEFVMLYSLSTFRSSLFHHVIFNVTSRLLHLRSTPFYSWFFTAL